MRILYLSQYFPPEAGATQTRSYEMARNFVRLGHSVTMLCEVPNHPSGIIHPDYRGKLFVREKVDGIDVLHVWVKASPVKSFRNRMLFYLSFMTSTIFFGLLLARGAYDVIYASSPPLFVGGAALVLSKVKRKPLAFEVRDLWPESAVALGELQNRRAIDLASRLEQACYRSARVIVVVTQGIHDRLIERGIPAYKLSLIPNGANTDLFQFSPGGRQQIRSDLGLEDKFIAIYAGIFGIAQGLETLVEAARQLQSDPDIHFLLIGDGPKKADVADLARQYALTNLTILSEQARERMPDYLSAADVSLIPLRKLEIFKGALPSKLFDAWACERPVLLSVDGEARHTLEEAQGGLFVPPEDPQALAQALIQLKKSPVDRPQMGSNGRAYTIQNYSRQQLAEKLINLLQHTLA